MCGVSRGLIRTNLSIYKWWIERVHDCICPIVRCRIRECERELLPGSSMKVPVELWDCSGDQKYVPC